MKCLLYLVGIVKKMHSKCTHFVINSINSIDNSFNDSTNKIIEKQCKYIAIVLYIFMYTHFERGLGGITACMTS